MTHEPEYTNRCACGWEVTGAEDVVVDATIDHGRRMHNMEATRDEVLAALHSDRATDATVAAADRDDRRTA
jgi:predicted small metal-binding protein